MRIDDASLEKLSRLFVEEREESERMFADLQAGRAAHIPEERKLGKYILVRELGRGGVGKVWLAWEPELKRTVAVKILGPQMRHEAQMLAKIDHPNIAKVYEVGEAHGMHYIAMQYIDGKSLDGVTLTPTAAARIVRDAARIIQTAHERGILHRDLKPGNLMLKDDTVFVIDFGLAKPIDSTVTGSIAGTVAFMSPEQAAGEKPLPDADIYSLGATLYRLASGRAPFEGSNLRDVMNKIARHEFDRPRGINPKITADLDAIIVKAMGPLGMRYVSAKELADDLDRFLRFENVEARTGVARRMAWVARRHKLSLLFIGALILIGAFFVGRMFMVRNNVEQILRGVDTMIQAGELQMASAMLDRVVQMDGLSPAVIERRNKIKQSELARIDKAADLLSKARALLEQAELNLYKKGAVYAPDFTAAEKEVTESLRLKSSAEGYYLLARMAHLNNRYDWALSSYQNALDMKPEYVEARIGMARVHVDRAVDALFSGNEQESTFSLESARKCFEPVQGIIESDVAEAWRILASGEPEAAIDYARKRVDKNEEFHVIIGVAQARMKQYREAMRSFTSAIDARPNYFQAYFYRGTMLRQAGNLDYALREYDRAIQIFPRYARAMAARGDLHFQRGDADLAIKDWDQAGNVQPELRKEMSARIERAKKR